MKRYYKTYGYKGQFRHPLILVLLLLSFSACGGSSSNEKLVVNDSSIQDRLGAANSKAREQRQAAASAFKGSPNANFYSSSNYQSANTSNSANGPNLSTQTAFQSSTSKSKSSALDIGTPLITGALALVLGKSMIGNNTLDFLKKRQEKAKNPPPKKSESSKDLPALDFSSGSKEIAQSPKNATTATETNSPIPAPTEVAEVIRSKSQVTRGVTDLCKTFPNGSTTTGTFDRQIPGLSKIIAGSVGSET